MIPFEKFSHSSSLAYFNYEEKLHLYDPVISNMVSERYRCTIYSDFDDEEDETDYAYETEEEEFSDLKKMEPNSVSVIDEISNNDFISGSSNQDSDLQTLGVIPTISNKSEIEGCTVKFSSINCPLKPSFLNPEVKDEEKSWKIGTDDSKFFNLKSEIDFLIFKNALLVSPDSVCTSHTESVFASDLLPHDLRLEFGNTQSPTLASPPVTIVFAKTSGISSFTFDPGGVSKDTVYGVSDFIAVFHRQLASDLPYGAAQHRNFVFDRGKPPLATDRIRSSSYSSSTVLIERCVDLIFAKPVLVFDPEGTLAIVHRLFDVVLTMREEDELIFTDLISQKLTEDPILVFDPGGSLRRRPHFMCS